MKKLLAFVFVVLTFAGCNFAQIDGNGKIVTKKINSIKNISEIEASGAFDIKVIIADSTSLEINTDSNLLKYVGLKITGDKLKIFLKENVNPTDDIDIKLFTPHLTGIELTGANDLTVKGINEKELSIDCSGASSLTLSGTVEKIDAEISGSANLDSSELFADNVRLDVSGAADAKVRAKKSLRISASGAADIEYIGEPELVNVDVSGAATVQKVKK